MRIESLAIFLCMSAFGCGDRSEQWAFAMNTDGSLKEREFCRETLAESLTSDALRSRVSKVDDSRLFYVQGAVETFYIAVFSTANDCETALAVARKRP